MSNSASSFSCVSWNIHRCIGNDGIVDPARTQSVLCDDVWQAGHDALILQEAEACGVPYRSLLDIPKLEAETGLRSVHTDSAHRWSSESDGFLGIIILVDPSLIVKHVQVLDLPGWTHRGAVVVDLVKNGRPLRLIGTHLSLSQALRWVQMRAIAQYIERQSERPTILAGDLNEWRPWGGLALSPRALGMAFKGPVKATFPVRRPILPLDRVLAVAPAIVRDTQVLDSAAIRATSDHRPLAATFDLGD